MMRILKFLPIVLVGLAAAATIPCQAQDEAAYVVEERGRSSWLSLFDPKMSNSVRQWDVARAAQNEGNLKKAGRLMRYLVRRWPNSKEAPWAQRARADMLYARSKYETAFGEYQFLIDNYSGRMLDYDSVLESQYKIAEYMMNRRRMRWVFGGYRAPEYSVDYFETVIRNGPQGARAPEAQFNIGQAYMENKEYEMAISAFGVMGYRYPDHALAEKAAWKQITCLNRLRQKFPRSVEMLDRTLTATTVFLSTYPQSDRKPEIIQMRNKLYETKAQQAFDEAEFYAEVPRRADAAIIYYEKMIEEFPKSRLVPKAQKRIEELKRLLAMPKQSAKLPPRSRPLPFTAGGR